MLRWIARIFVSLFLGVVGFAIAGLLAVYLGKLSVPEQWNPFAPYDLRAPIGPLTPLQYWRTMRSPELCRTALTFTGLHYQQVPDEDPPSGCTLLNVVRVSGGAVRFNHPFLATCALALGVARFATGDLQAAAHARYGQSIREIDHVGSYACRGVRAEDSHASMPLSQHAYANALDVSAFVLADGRKVTIGGDWKGRGVDAEFLHTVHAAACRAFNTTLGPDYNALHAAHFHVDMGPYQICR